MTSKLKFWGAEEWQVNRESQCGEKWEERQSGHDSIQPLRDKKRGCNILDPTLNSPVLDCHGVYLFSLAQYQFPLIH